MKSDYMNNPELQEEQEHLDKTLSIIETLICTSLDKIDDIKDKIKDFGPAREPSDIDAKQSLFDDVNYEREKLDEYSVIKICPYFGRIDLEGGSNSAEETYYIGEKGLGNANKRIILDWRSKIGNLYYDRDHKNFTVNGYNYNLLLRRSIQIQNSILKSVHTDYDTFDLESDSEVIDSFLIAVLKEKRRNKKLTDIIKTIQANQNRIIRRNIKDSFIVQGCAGSGKTMILLHRLSYILYNNKNLDKSKLMIITPNEYFNNHLNELSKHLDIDEIPRFTTEELYAWIINHYGIFCKNEDVLPKEIDKKTKTEGSLNEQLLSILYSTELADEISSNWDKHFSYVEESIDNKLSEYIKRYEVDWIKNTESYYSRYSSIIKIMYAIGRRASEAETKLKALNKQMQDLLNERSQNQQNLSDAQTSYKMQLPKFKKLISEFIVEEEQIINDYQNDVLLVEDKIRKQNANIEPILHQRDNIRRRKEQVSKISDFDIETIKSAKDPFYGNIRKEKENEIKEIDDIISAQASLPFFRFLEKHKLEKEKIRLTGELTEYANTQKENLLSELSWQFSDLETRCYNQKSKAKALEKERSSISSKMDWAASLLSDAVELKDSINSTKPLLNEDIINKLDLKTDIIKYKKKVDDAIDKLAGTDEKIKKTSKAIDKEKSLIFNDNDKTIFSQIASSLNYISIKAEKKYFEDIIKTLYEDHSEKYRENKYRHQRYLTAYWLSLYYGSFSTRYFISIDEAQDLSVSEYRLLKNVFGGNAVFNLYGDINQGIYSYRGTDDWENLKEISKSIEYLNENYRNAIEITTHCNDEFGMKMIPIGLSGGQVDLLGITESIGSLLDSLKEGMTCAIICNDTQGIIKSIRYDNSSFIINDIDSNKISVITPELSKGLEFRHVAVLPDGMDYNNKYVAYTRALEKLTIIESR